MGTRIFILPGFGVNSVMYEPLASYLESRGFEVKHIDYRQILPQIRLTKLTGIDVVQKIIQHYRILPQDKLIGHSTGGYFSFLIREIQQNEICMISSFSDCKKIVHFLPNPIFTPFLSLSGLMKSSLVKNYMLSKIKGRNIEKPSMEAMSHFKDFSNEDLFKLSWIITFDEKQISVLPNPLRIHSKEDRVVRVPNEPYVEVKGAHFPLDLDFENVMAAMQGFLSKKKSPQTIVDK